MRYMLIISGLLILIFCIYNYWPASSLPHNLKTDKIVVHKKHRILELWSGGNKIVTYHIALGAEPYGHKIREGDGKTPEGQYCIDSKNQQSQFYLNLGIFYPNAADRKNAENLGTDPGGDIKIHGLPKGYGWIGRMHR